jgi:hypothetical protein
MTKAEIQREFEGCSEQFVAEIVKNKNLIARSNFYSNFSFQQVFNSFRFPIVVDNLIDRYVKKSKAPASQTQYENLLSNFWKEIKIVSVPESMEKMNADKLILFKLCFLSQLTYQTILSQKIDEDFLVFILIETIREFHKTKIQAGEFVGLQCAQAFSKEVTQQSISAFHQTKIQQ